MSVTGRMVGTGAVVLTVSMTGGVDESTEGTWPESMGGGETATGLRGLGELGGLGGLRGLRGLRGLGGRGDISLRQGEVESNCGS